jgi:two-component system chemotaxis response regulator CheB
MKAKGVAKDFPVVCVGGSAGGLDAYTRLLRHLPADMGVAIVIVNHLRTVATQLHELLPRYTEMPVELITEGLVIQSNRVFIIPAQRDLHVLGGQLWPRSCARNSSLDFSASHIYHHLPGATADGATTRAIRPF